MQKTKLFLAAATFAAALPLLQGCFPAVVAGGAAGVLSAHDRRSTGTQTDDETTEWRGQKLGYVPRAENRIIAAAMDAGDRLTARVSSVSDNKNPWLRVAFEVFVEL